MFLYSAVTAVALLLAARDNQQRREIGVVLPLEATEHLFDVAALERFSEVLRAGVRLAVAFKHVVHHAALVSRDQGA